LLKEEVTSGQSSVISQGKLLTADVKTARFPISIGCFRSAGLSILFPGFVGRSAA
jgi:hypothetical protein